ncbi:MAG: VOC family protein [Halobacteriales archaeon]
MHGTPIRVEHVGIAVESVPEPESVLQALGCVKVSDEAVLDDGSVPIEEAGPDARFRWTYYELGDASRVELISPIAEESFLTRYLDANGPGLHHVTLEVADIDAVIEALEQVDVDVVDYETFDDWTEAFVSPANPTGTLFQLMEFEPSYEAGRRPRSELYVNGFPVRELDA